MDKFEEDLTTVLAREIDGFSKLLGCEKLTAGASQETYRIDIESDCGSQRLALRRSVPTLETSSSVGAIDLATEAQLFRLAVDAGIPEPQVHYVLEEKDGLGEGFIMQWLEGETLGQRIVRSDALAEVRPRLAAECGEALARIHALQWQGTALESALPVVSPEALIDETWAHYRDLAVPVPMIDFSWRWLKDNLPAQSRQTLVHGDFRNGNLMIGPEGIVAVLDWELAHVGDPVRDLGWLCVNSWRFGRSDLPVGGFGEIEQLLSAYRAESGIEVSHEELHFWQVFGSFWWAMATLRMANSWRTGETPSLERPVIGRRSSEAQMDCVNLLMPGAFKLPHMDRDIARGTQLPMPAELLSGVAEFLKSDVAPVVEGHHSFLARVAANSLGIAQREFLHGSHLAEQECERLRKLLGREGTLDELRLELVSQLRGDLPLDTPGLGDHLRQTVAGQLAIDQPGYSALK